MTGERNLEKLLKDMSPELIEGEYVFCTFADAQYGDYTELNPIAFNRETEGISLVIPKSKADEFGYRYESAFKGITLKIHSSLDAVGLTAVFSNKLSAHEISANVIAGYYHDHIFVRSAKAEMALSALKEFSASR